MALLNTQRDLSQILKTSQQKAVSTGLLTLALITALIYGSLRPTILTIIETNAKYEQKQASLAIYERQNTALTNLLVKQTELATQLKAFDYYYPYDGDYSLFIVNLNRIAQKFQFRLNGISFSDTYFRKVGNIDALQFTGMTPVTFQVSLTGNITNLPSFLSYLENTPFFPKVLSVSYTPSASDTNASSTGIGITLLLYKLNTSAAPNEQQ